MISEQTQFPSGVIPSTETDFKRTLESLLVRSRRLPLARAKQLPVRIRLDADHGQLVDVPHVVSTLMAEDERGWQECYDHLPWEDRRSGEAISFTASLTETLLAHVSRRSIMDQADYRRRYGVLFGFDGCPWRPELTVERHEALNENGLLPETTLAPMQGLMLAMALGHLRGELRAMPLPFGMMPQRFTIPQLQASVEGLMGELQEKQAFRRQVTMNDLLEDAGGLSDEIFGRPARLFRIPGHHELVPLPGTIYLRLPVADAPRQTETPEFLFGLRPGSEDELA